MQKNVYTRSLKRLLRPGVALVVVAAVAGLDAWLKQRALATFPLDSHITNPGLFALAVHKNFGIAFNIPFQMPLIIGVSILIGSLLLHVAYKNRTRHPQISAAALAIIIGALGNLADRITHGFTVDYLIIGGRSAVNLSDLLIIVGVIWLLLASRRSRTHHLIHPDEPQ